MKVTDTLEDARTVMYAAIKGADFDSMKVISVFLGLALALDSLIVTIENSPEIGPLPPTLIALRNSLKEAITTASAEVAALDALQNSRN